jgi:hypothetical protein
MRLSKNGHGLHGAVMLEALDSIGFGKKRAGSQVMDCSQIPKNLCPLARRAGRFESRRLRIP